ncbi:MAG: hypothetical protein HZC49_03860 [Nitrospirae bacterium]|nr:hypothetical protein [Nitrospirota bacterium]
MVAVFLLSAEMTVYIPGCGRKMLYDPLLSVFISVTTTSPLEFFIVKVESLLATPASVIVPKTMSASAERGRQKARINMSSIDHDNMGEGAREYL